MFMKMGNHIQTWWLSYSSCETKNDLDKALSVGKEIYKLAEECGADAHKVADALEKLKKTYDNLCKEPKFSGKADFFGQEIKTQ